MKRLGLLSIVVVSIATGCAPTQDSLPDMAGMWSDLPASEENSVCFLTCTDESQAYMAALLADPANLELPYNQLQFQTWMHQVQVTTPGYLTPAALAVYPLDMAQDPGLIDCEPWGLARQIFVPHQMELTQYGDRIEMHYAEWDTVRTIYLDGREPPSGSPTRLGFSAGHYEGDVLVVESSGIRPSIFEGLTLGAVQHSDQLRVVERYSLSEDGNRLDMVAVFEDPSTLREPLAVTRGWAWSPDEEIFEYLCELPDE